MSEHEIEPLDPDLRALLDAERAPPDLPREAATRVLERVEASAGLRVAPGAPGAAGGARDVTHGLLSRRLPFGMVMFVLGGLVGAGLHAVLGAPTRPERVAPHASTSLSPPVTVPSGPAPITPSAPPPDAAVPEPAPVVHPTPAPATVSVSPMGRDARDSNGASRDVDLAAERSLLEIARSALARGQAEGALDAVQRHARRFPRGQLTEEREGVWIQALVAAGRSAEARVRAAEFRRRFPQSILRPVVEAAVQSIP